jgi:hypothetical protein
MGDAATDGADFALYDEPKKEWLDWAPKIAIDTNVAQSGSGDTTLPHAPDVVRSAVGAK